MNPVESWKNSVNPVVRSPPNPQVLVRGGAGGGVRCTCRRQREKKLGQSAPLPPSQSPSHFRSPFLSRADQKTPEEDAVQTPEVAVAIRKFLRHALLERGSQIIRLRVSG